MNRVDSSLEGISANLRGEGVFIRHSGFRRNDATTKLAHMALEGRAGPNKTVKFLESDAKKYSIGFLSFDHSPHWWLRKTSSFL